MKWLLKKGWWFPTLGIGILCLYVLPPLPPFRLTDVIVVTPTMRVKETELVRKAGVKEGDHLWRLRLSEIRRRILESPWIEEVALAKGYPGRLVISVREETPVALIKLDHLYLVNRRGEIFKKLEGNDPKDLPVLTGFRKQKGELGPYVELIRDFNETEGLRPVGLSEVVWNDKSGLTLFTVRPAVKVVLGRDRWKERLERLVRVLPEVSVKRGEAVSIDLTYEKRIFVKK